MPKNDRVNYLFLRLARLQVLSVDGTRLDGATEGREERVKESDKERECLKRHLLLKLRPALPGQQKPNASASHW